MHRIAIIATGDLDIIAAPIGAVASILSSAGLTVDLCLGPDAGAGAIDRMLSGGGYDLAWIGLIPGPYGWTLADRLWAPAELGRWLTASGARWAIVNECRPELIERLRRAAPGVDLAIAPAGPQVDPAARAIAAADRWATAAYIARGLAEGADLAQAITAAPEFEIIRGSSMAGPSGPSESGKTTDDIYRALKGDPFTNTPGLIRQVDNLARDLQSYLARDEQWKRETEQRLAALERGRGGPIELSPRAMSIVLATAVILAFLAIYTMLRLGGA